MQELTVLIDSDVFGSPSAIKTTQALISKLTGVQVDDKKALDFKAELSGFSSYDALLDMTEEACFYEVKVNLSNTEEALFVSQPIGYFYDDEAAYNKASEMFKGTSIYEIQLYEDGEPLNINVLDPYPSVFDVSVNSDYHMFINETEISAHAQIMSGYKIVERTDEIFSLMRLMNAEKSNLGKQLIYKTISRIQEANSIFFLCKLNEDNKDNQEYIFQKQSPALFDEICASMLSH